MRKILQLLFEYKTLSRVQAREVMMQVAEGKFSDTEIAAFTTAVSYTHLDVYKRQP